MSVCVEVKGEGGIRIWRVRNEELLDFITLLLAILFYIIAKSEF